MRTKKVKSAVVRMSCQCGYRWMAIFSKGIFRREVKCHQCSSLLKTSTGSRAQ